MEEYEVEDNEFCSWHSREIQPFNFFDQPQNVATFCRQMGGKIFVMDRAEVIEEAFSSLTLYQNALLRNLTYLVTGICIRSDGQLENLANRNIILPETLAINDYEAGKTFNDQCIFYNNA